MKCLKLTGRVSRDSENVFCINIFKEEPTMPVSLDLNTKYRAPFSFFYFLLILAINVSLWTLRRINYSFYYVSFALFYALFYH